MYTGIQGGKKGERRERRANRVFSITAGDSKCPTVHLLHVKTIYPDSV